MKKIIAFVLALTLLLSMSATVFATSTTETESGNSHEILASYKEGTQDSTVISVDISWKQMSFTYNGASSPVWNADEHRYEGEKTEAGWAKSEAIITIQNNSNTILQALLEYKQETDFAGLSMHFTDTAPYIGSANTADAQDEEGVKGTPCIITIKAIPDGELDENTQDNTKIGVITITVQTVDSAALVLDMLDNLDILIAKYKNADTSNLARGAVYLASGTDTAALLELTSNAKTVYASAEKTETEKNVAVNAALTAFYGALEIAQ